MAVKTNHWKLGLFVVVCVFLGLAGLAGLAAHSLHQEVVEYITYFDESVQGLELGSPVKFRGVTIGSVSKIDLAPDRRNVAVTCDIAVEVLNDLHLVVAARTKTALGRPPDLRIQLATAGLTGLKYLSMDFFNVTDNPEPVLPFKTPENYIPAAPSTIKNIEESLTRTINQVPELALQVSRILERLNGMLEAIDKQKLPERSAATLTRVDTLLDGVQAEVGQLRLGKLSGEAEQTLAHLDTTVTKLNKVLDGVGGDKGFLMSVQRATDTVGDVAHTADGLGGELGATLRSVQEAADALRRLADSLERDPDMLLKGRATAVSR